MYWMESLQHIYCTHTNSEVNSRYSPFSPGVSKMEKYEYRMQKVLGARGVHLADQDEQQHGVGLQGLQNTLCAKSRGSCVQIRLPVHRRDYADYPKFSSTRLHDYYLHLKLDLSSAAAR